MSKVGVCEDGHCVFNLQLNRKCLSFEIFSSPYMKTLGSSPFMTRLSRERLDFSSLVFSSKFQGFEQLCKNHPTVILSEIALFLSLSITFVTVKNAFHLKKSNNNIIK